MSHSGPLKPAPANVNARLKEKDLEDLERIREALARNTLLAVTRSDAARHAIRLVGALLEEGLPGALPTPTFVRSVARAMTQSATQSASAAV